MPILVFAVLLGWQELAPDRRTARTDWRRMATNWALGIGNWLMAALIPVSALAASWASPSPLLDGLPMLLALALLVLARSLASYWLHRLAHEWPWLWQVHRLHHSDREIDMTTALRSHPIEALIAAAMAALVVALLGAGPTETLAADALLFSATLWHHAAIRMPRRWSAVLERVVVTPRFHRLHHSVRPDDHDRNYGDLLTVWDRMFGTFKPPRRGPFAVGLVESRAPEVLRAH
ncbi:sterol desaturase family protein [Novosphingobium sp. MW5]|nr:sterol desaturase family protein [Novosphingobium sp. MW5]